MSPSGDPLTVGQLIDLLGEVEDKSLPIYSEGCDCIELAYTIDEYEGNYGGGNQGILIERKMVTHPPRRPLPTLEELEAHRLTFAKRYGVAPGPMTKGGIRT